MLGTVYPHKVLHANRHVKHIAALANVPLTVQTVKELVALGDGALHQTRLVHPDCFG